MIPLFSQWLKKLHCDTSWRFLCIFCILAPCNDENPWITMADGKHKPGSCINSFAQASRAESASSSQKRSLGCHSSAQHKFQIHGRIAFPPAACILQRVCVTLTLQPVWDGSSLRTQKLFRLDFIFGSAMFCGLSRRVEGIAWECRTMSEAQNRRSLHAHLVFSCLSF